MKHLYLDTSVLLARWAPLDVHHSSSLSLYKALSAGKIIGYLSDFSLAEIASVVERQQAKFQATLPPNTQLALEFVKKIRLTPNLVLVCTSAESKIVIAQQTTSLSTVYWKSIDVAITTKLKTLDNIHLAITSSLFTLIGRKMDYFVTADHEILKKGLQIGHVYGFQVVSPEKLVKIENL